MTSARHSGRVREQLRRQHPDRLVGDGVGPASVVVQLRLWVRSEISPHSRDSRSSVSGSATPPRITLIPAVSQMARAPALSQRASSWARPWQTATIRMPLPALSAIQGQWHRADLGDLIQRHQHRRVQAAVWLQGAGERGPACTYSANARNSGAIGASSRPVPIM